MSSPENGKEEGGNKGGTNQGTGNHHGQNPPAGFFSSDTLEIGAAFILFVFSSVFHVAGGWFHIFGFICDFLIIWCGLTIISHHTDERKFKLFGLRYWLSVCLAFIVISALADYVVCKEERPPSPNPQPEPLIQTAWQPPELPPGCTNVTVYFGTLAFTLPLWAAEMPRIYSLSTNAESSTNFIDIPISPNIKLRLFSFEDTNTDDIGTTYWIKDLPPEVEKFYEQSTNYSPRNRHVTLATGYTTVDMGSGNFIEAPVWPFVSSNRMFVDVEIPFINKRKRILLDTNIDYAVSGIPRLWDINYNSNQFEMVNEKTNPVLQVTYLSPNAVRVNGIYIYDVSDFYAAFDSMPTNLLINLALTDGKINYIIRKQDIRKMFPFMMFNTNAAYDVQFPKQNRIFKYPSRDFYGVLDDPPPQNFGDKVALRIAYGILWAGILWMCFGWIFYQRPFNVNSP